ncbi:MAG: J domain-containing protein [Actinomycetota bacterium]
MSGSSGRTHYEVLGVGANASAKQMRDAHRRLARLLHPDRQAGASPAERALAERRMQEVNAAWTVLSDPDRRRRYDRSLRPTDERATTPPGPSPQPEADDPDEYFARVRAAEVDPDEPPMGAASFWLLRRGPIVAALFVAVILFVGTALAGGGRGAAGSGSDDSPPPLAPDSQCVTRQSDGSLRTVDCAEDHEAVIELAGVSVPQACRDGEEFERLNTNEGVCLRTLDGWIPGP